MNRIYLLVRVDETSRLLDRAKDDDVAYESIVIDHLNHAYGGFGLEVIDCEMTDNAHGSIASHVRDLLPCPPEDDWWPEQPPLIAPAPPAPEAITVTISRELAKWLQWQISPDHWAGSPPFSVDGVLAQLAAALAPGAAADAGAQ
jgi:hypothetical protein